MRLRVGHVVLAAAALAVLAIAPAAQASAAVPASCDPMQTPPLFRGAVPTAEEVLGFALGSREVTAAEANAYVDAVDAASDRVVSGTFGSSWQGRRHAVCARRRSGERHAVGAGGRAGGGRQAAGSRDLGAGGGAAGAYDARRAVADGERPRRRGERDRRRVARALRARRPRRLRGAADPRQRRRGDHPDAESGRARGGDAAELLRVRHEPRLVRAHAGRDRHQARVASALPGHALCRRATRWAPTTISSRRPPIRRITRSRRSRCAGRTSSTATRSPPSSRASTSSSSRTRCSTSSRWSTATPSRRPRSAPPA